MLNADTRVELVDWSLDDINLQALSTLIVMKRGFRSFGSGAWNDQLLNKVILALEYREPKPVYLGTEFFDLFFYGVNQPRTLEFDADGFVWRQPEPRLVIGEQRIPQSLEPRFDYLFRTIARWAQRAHNLVAKDAPKSLVFPAEYFAWGVTYLPNAVPLNALVRNRQQFPELRRIKNG